jgi:hypothetical protein
VALLIGIRCRSAVGARCRYKPVLYHRFKHSVALMISSPSRFRFGEIMSFAPLKTRSVSALIAGIDSKLSAIVASCVKPEFAHYLKRFSSLRIAVDGPLR